MKKVAYYTLGCKLNFSETSTFARQFKEGGYARTSERGGADICVINTCSVTADADKKCRNTVRRAIKENPGAIIAVTGCYAQLKPEEIAAIKGVDLVLGNNDKGLLFERADALSADRAAIGADEAVNPINIIGDDALKVARKPEVHSCSSEEIRSFFPSFSSGDRTRAFLKVQDGCDYHCSYCTIPKARGVSRNAPVNKIVEQAKIIAAKGQHEIVLTGVNIGDFGRSTGESFIELLHGLDAVKGVDRYRISSIEPNLLTDEVIDFCAASAKFQPHFHVPLQSGCNKILGLMRRRYTTEKFADRIAAVRQRMPRSFIGIDVIVGFPGETDEDFMTTYNFLKELKPAFLHIFPYSERPDTPAIDFCGKVFADEAKRRAHLLGELCQELHTEFCKEFEGQRALALMEADNKNGMMYGFTQNYVRVEIPYNKEMVNQIIELQLIEYSQESSTMRCGVAEFE